MLRAPVVRFRHRFSARCSSTFQGARACSFSQTILMGFSEEISRAVGPASAVFSAVLLELRIPGFDHPAGEMLPRNVGQGTNPVGTLVEAGRQMKFPASRTEEDLSPLDADFFERLQAIRDEPRTDHAHAAHALPAVLSPGGHGTGLYPFRPPQPGPES